MKIKVNSFAYAVLCARLGRDLTQSQVAEVVGISERWMQRIEQGKIPGGKVVLRLIVFLELDRNDFREEVKDLVPIPPRGRIYH